MTAHIHLGENYTIIQFQQRGLPGVAVVNSALKTFEFALDFSWHFSILIECNDFGEDGLPSISEQEVLSAFEDRIEPLLKADQNGLPLARITHDGHKELIWRIRSPEIADRVMQDFIRERKYSREFDYRIDEDPSWKKASWYLDSV